MNSCSICSEDLDNGLETVELTARGSEGIANASRLRGDSLTISAGQSVHKKCRQKYTNSKDIASCKRKREAEASACQQRTLRSENVFSFQNACLFCGLSVIDEGLSRLKDKRTLQADVYAVRTFDFQVAVLETCNERTDAWSDIVYARIQYAGDLHAADAMYHQECSVRFRTGKSMLKQQNIADASPSVSGIKRSKLGRPTASDSDDAFLKVVQYLSDNDDEQISINDLIAKMKEYLDGSEPYSFKYMKEKLQVHLGDRIIITNINGRPNIVTFREKASSLLHAFYNAPKQEDTEWEKLRLLDTAAKLLKNDIKAQTQNTDVYSSSEDISSTERNLNFIPSSLKHFLNRLFVGTNTDSKIAAIGQAVMQSARPRTILAPLQIGIGVQMHRQFGSRVLVDTLNSLGFSASYSEVQKFERSASVHQGTDIAGYTPDMFLQYVADNVDHNIRTLDGLNTFHGMGIITTVTPGRCSSTVVPRVTISSADIAAVGKIHLKYFKAQENFKSSLKFENLTKDYVDDATCNIDILWKMSWLLKPVTPSWNGFMQMTHAGNHPGKSMVYFMPMIDLKPSDEHCIYSTMCFVAEEARKYNASPILTFDQPLWWKALGIQQHPTCGRDMQNIILRLGGLHIEMSFLGSIGHLMGGSGLKEALEMVYADNTVSHMLTGKAISRALRGHLLVESVLHALLLSSVYNVPLPCDMDQTTINELTDEREPDTSSNVSEPTQTDVTQDTHISEPSGELEAAAAILDRLLQGKTSVQDACSNTIWNKINQRIEQFKTSVSNFRTSKLWLQYLETIEILRTFIKAERTGNWTLHLHALNQMLPYFAATGHNLYTKSVYLYLQNMSKLPTDHPEVYKRFCEGFHVVRRSDRYWGGLSTDLVIEQMLMRSMKTTGGLTRGRGFTEQQRTVWLLSTPACASICEAMQQFTGVDNSVSEQHKDSRKSRLQRDDKDMRKLCDYFVERNPFTKEGCLVNIVSGVTSDENVNVDNAKHIGTAILNTMSGKQVVEFSFKKKDQAVTLDSRTTVRIDDENVKVDPHLLFQRLLSAARNTSSREELDVLFSFELSTHPPSIFASDGLLRPARKPQLAEAILSSLSSDQSNDSAHSPRCIVDGGSLLQRIPWIRGSTYQEICQQYLDYIVRHFGNDAIVVFDGYMTGPSTKDTTHIRRTQGHVGNTVQFSRTMNLNMKKEIFLANIENKQSFIDMLSLYLQENSIETKQAESDADALIVQTAVESSSEEPAAVIGDDTDLLVLLCYHTQPENKPVYFKPQQKKKSRTQRSFEINEIQQILGKDVCNNILFIHAVLGCDTTSGVHGIGKSAALKLFKTSPIFRETAAVFNSENATRDDIIKAGEKALVLLYGGRPDDTLDSLRQTIFFQKIAVSVTCVKPEILPPTLAAGKYHSLRVYHQIQVWKGNATINPEEYGWKLSKGYLVAITTDKPPAPDVLLKVVRCKCKTNCQTARCTCKKHGLDCSAMCGECRGVSCLNATQAEPAEPDDILVDE